MDRLLIVLCVLLLFISQINGQTGPGVDCLCLEEIVSARGSSNPTSIGNAHDGSRRLFATDQNGLIWVFTSDWTRLETPYLNITETIFVSFECGLLAFTFHPDYATNGFVYLYYCMGVSDNVTMRLSEVQVSETDADIIDPTSERVLMDINMGTGYLHAGGGLLFGPEGYLYLTIGDGADPNGNAQNLGTLLGGVLRIDVDTTTGNLPYGIPPDNPYLDDPDARPEVFAIGLRNPFKASMDRGDYNTGAGYGRILLGDVGDMTWEEVDLLQAGGNYGWSGREGPECYNLTLCGNTEPEVFPIFYYNRTIGWCVIAGNVYRGCANPNLNGWFIFGDHNFGALFGLREVETDVWAWEQFSMCDICPDGLVNKFPTFIISFGEDEQGEVYFGSTDAALPSSQTASIFKVVDPNNSQPPCVT